MKICEHCKTELDFKIYTRIDSETQQPEFLETLECSNCGERVIKKHIIWRDITGR